MNRPSGTLAMAFLSMFVAAWLPPAHAQQAGATGTQETHPVVTDHAGLDQFLRIRRDDNGQPVALQTALTRYRDTNRDLLVDLVGVVHIGEANYYQRLNQQLGLYDAVLYELVAPEGMQVPGPERGSDHPIGWLQDSMRSMLGLQSQLEKIDYRRDNFVHADLTPEEITQRMRSRGDNALTIGLNTLADMIREANRAAANPNAASSTPTVDEDDFSRFLDMAAHPVKLKRFMAEQFTGGELEHGLGQSLNQLLIDDRNEAAMQVLERQIELGHRRVAIFYGAAHMPDFSRRLEDDFGMRRTHQVWVDAWDLTRAPDDLDADGPAAIMRQLLKVLDQ